jgi:pyruvate/2-oxoglutarate dehydrogenase complex dihydrolipoamide acyltransferase (E2) component
MPFWYFFTVPELPKEVAHQSNAVDVQKYLIAEGKPVSTGTPIAVVENYWAIMQLNAAGNGILRKVFFDEPATVKCGDPVAIVACDGDDLIYNNPKATVTIVKIKHVKPRS